jgi:hypothetical protein
VAVAVTVAIDTDAHLFEQARHRCNIGEVGGIRQSQRTVGQ